MTDFQLPPLPSTLLAATKSYGEVLHTYALSAIEDYKQHLLRGAAMPPAYFIHPTLSRDMDYFIRSQVEIIRVADKLQEREKLAQWMLSMSFATGHGDTMEDLLGELGSEVRDRIKARCRQERERCAKVCDEHGLYGHLPALEIRTLGD